MLGSKGQCAIINELLSKIHIMAIHMDLSFVFANYRNDYIRPNYTSALSVILTFRNSVFDENLLGIVAFRTI